ncbi:MAG: hypothetical protein J0M25_11755 [Flavobacteriales bacterium]|nr:hypothetical protein [Flavobacteriales bacterium]
MEEKIKDIFNNIKERLSNPFLFSFLIAFLFYNWEITLSIFYNDYNQIKAEGFKSIFEFVRNRWDNNGKLFMPFLIALLYTFVFPIFRNLVNAFQTWIIKWGEDWNLKISKDSKIGIDKYLALRDNYIEKTKSLEEIISSESKFLIELDLKTKEIDELKNENSLMKDRIDNANTFLNTYKSIEFLNGNWNFKKFKNDTTILEKFDYYIEDSKILVLNNGTSYYKYEILNFYHIITDKKIQFVKRVHNFNEINNKEKIEYIICDLSYRKPHKLVGTENGVNVEYTKVNEELPF